jgi:UDP-N-acetylglucosamine 2-epimerase (non-hydrolysing)
MKKKTKVLSVVGARPNFIKIAPVHKAFLGYPDLFEHKICHTGQHYDASMSDVFFMDLEMPQPSFFLNAGGGTHAEQTARIIERFEKVLIEYQPDLVLVPGDVNSTMACSVTAVKMGIKVGHIESGLRSFDRSMPEEINRIITDSISDYLFVTEDSGLSNLRREGIPNEKIFLVGNTMIDNLIAHMDKITKKKSYASFDLNPKEYVVVTFHRPSNVDNPDQLEKMVIFLNKLAKATKIIFPIHPRTKNNLGNLQINGLQSNNLHLTSPLGYIDFMSLVYYSNAVITDSGGIQEETTFLKIPCITVRNTTERPVTTEIGSNLLVGGNFEKAFSAWRKINEQKNNEFKTPQLWDGRTSGRIVEIIKEKFSKP